MGSRGQSDHCAACDVPPELVDTIVLELPHAGNRVLGSPSIVGAERVEVRKDIVGVRDPEALCVLKSELPIAVLNQPCCNTGIVRERALKR